MIDQLAHARTGRFVVLTCNLEPSSDVPGAYVALCPALGVASQGDTLDEAEENIREAVSLYLAATDEDGELERILAEKGLKISALASGQAIKEPTEDGGAVIAESFPIDRAA